MTGKKANAKKTRKTGNHKKRRPLWTYWRFWVLIFGGMSALSLVVFLIALAVSLIRPDAASAAGAEREKKTPQTAQTDSGRKENNVIKTELKNSTQIVEWLNGSRNETIGEEAVTKVPSAAVNDEFFQEWWDEYGSNPAYNTAVIVYTDRENEGAYSLAHQMAYKNTGITQDQWGDWVHGDLKDGTLVYNPDQDGNLQNTQLIKNGTAVKTGE